MDLSGKVAFVTGASRGIGAAVARALSREGVSVGLASRRGDDLGLPDALGLACDVSDRAAVEDAVAATIERFGQLDICVANAGVGSYHSLVDTPVEHIEEMIRQRHYSPEYSVSRALRHYAKIIQSLDGDYMPERANDIFVQFQRPVLSMNAGC